MSLGLLISLYIILDFLVINAFFTQRALKEVSERLVGTNLSHIYLPPWYNLVRIPQVLTWIILAYMIYEYPWYWAVGIFIIDMLISAIFPIPKSKYKWAENQIKGKI